jgi:hypothetical protein
MATPEQLPERVTALRTALNSVSQQRVTIDNSLTQLTADSGAITTTKTELTAAQTDLMQADLATVATLDAGDGTRIGDCAAWIGKSFRQVAGSGCSQLLASSLLSAGFHLSSTMER